MHNTHHWITGKAQWGDGRGAALGFPTANLTLEQQSTRPSDGIYACWAQIQPEEKKWPAVLHVGPRPTFPGASATVELHLLNFPARPLYGETISFECIKKLRDVIHFPSVTQLVEAMHHDCAQTLTILQPLSS